MMTTTSDKLATGDVPFSTWIAELIALFPDTEEYGLASEIYSFAAAYENDMTPKEAYEDFDAWVTA